MFSDLTFMLLLLLLSMVLGVNVLVITVLMLYYRCVGLLLG